MSQNETPKPTTCEKAVHYVRALSRWIKAGRPVRTDEEIRYIHDVFCIPCERYDSKGKTCQCCGCKVNISSVPLANKIAMTTERCPLEKW